MFGGAGSRRCTPAPSRGGQLWCRAPRRGGAPLQGGGCDHPASAGQHAGSAVGARGLSRPGHVGSNPVPLAGGWISNHRTTREVRGACFL